MTDLFGNKLNVGDKVIFTKKSTDCCGRGKGLIKGTVANISKTGTACQVEYSHSQLAYIRLPGNILKYDWPEETNNENH